ncbi:phage virion morphogenesis protein [Methylocella sp.]|uniref:phage virion morphogenesis protein n=1 Tax=Methylocella sp. TaxID=1978226 RepID=UPI003785128E
MSGDEINPAAVYLAVLARAQAARAELEERIRRKLSGEVLNRRSGALADSIDVGLEEDGDGIALVASSAGVAYAAIHEFGGKTGAHEIAAVGGKALAFVAGGTQRFAKSVRHPGSAIPARPYLSTSVREVAEGLAAGLKQAALEALRKD